MEKNYDFYKDYQFYPVKNDNPKHLTTKQILHFNENWSVQTEHTSDVYSVFFITHSYGVVVGAGGSILITTNGGD